ncbi:hypothetical protein COS91_06125 [Candidatus Desantisbacteria bacterium CG07_land_8_20_14_0_80_39_15]|uniref:PIN domain-containing protein n=2 Tax=unclassified Candidatus Desantisiibacteriota TaxID=3106372 RepID=A0A2H9PAD0_9BACT|nr:MAG: hypothetical protein COS91_06125 [Candidatus Desantisbacteria bacterium CG07_land_8_20_14_0_80_39_15]PIZ15376.1 MAG: hypothetical protein COY51_05365 [Candidatus Desantisbacteria bacterium CG_4_10_14_0_8_um_filter_39_17]
MKILFDTNVLVAGFLNRGVCREVISIASIVHQIYYTDFIITELQNVLKNKFNIPEFLINRYFRAKNLSRNKNNFSKGISKKREDGLIISTLLFAF